MGVCVDEARMNFLEQLVAEWLEFNGYFVRRNVLVGRRAKGGYECELDVVALHPQRRHLLQVEPSMDSNSWAKRESRYQRKFAAGMRHIPSLFDGLGSLPHLDQVALFGYGSSRDHQKLAQGRVMIVDDLLAEVTDVLRNRPVTSHAVPEQYICLRTIQFCLNSTKRVADAPRLVPGQTSQ